MNYAYSHNQEEYYGPYITFEDATTDLDGDGGWVAEVVEAKTLVRIDSHDIERIIERVDEELAEEIFAEEPICEMSDSKRQELAAIVQAFIVEHATFNRFGIRNPVRVEPIDLGQSKEPTK